jgi:hypothetical protein
VKAHEETWEVRADETGQHREGDVFLVGSPRAVLRPFGNARYREGVTAADRAKLAAAAPEMARLLLEFYRIEDRGCFSLECNGPFDDGTHDATCEVRILLEKAGVLPT